jgi:hypothetical protein
MAIAKKGSRRIVVEAIPYRWTVRPRPTYAQALACGHLSFAVEMEKTGRTTLVVTVGASRPDNWVASQSSVVTPSLVERAIRQALSQGWRPSERGSPHALVLSAAQA